MLLVGDDDADGVEDNQRIFRLQPVDLAFDLADHGRHIVGNLLLIVLELQRHALAELFLVDRDSDAGMDGAFDDPVQQDNDGMSKSYMVIKLVRSII